MTEGRALTRLVILDGEVWEAGSVPPPEVSRRIKNPKCWQPVEGEYQLPWGPEGMPEVNTASRPVIPAAPAGNGISNLEEQAGGTEQSGVIGAEHGTVIGRDQLEPIGPLGPPAEAQVRPIQDEPVPAQDELAGERPDRELGDRIAVDESEPVLLSQEPPRSGRGASESAWRSFASARGVEVPADADRSQIINACRTAGVIQ